MEERKSSKTKCRIGVHAQTGRVQWSVGDEEKWPNRLKKLALIPLVLLPLIIVLVFLTKKADASQDLSYRSLDNFEILEDEDRREILRDLRTAFITYNQSEHFLNTTGRVRYPRHIHSRSLGTNRRDNHQENTAEQNIDHHGYLSFPELEEYAIKNNTNSPIHIKICECSFEHYCDDEVNVTNSSKRNDEVEIVKSKLIYDCCCENSTHVSCQIIKLQKVCVQNELNGSHTLKLDHNLNTKIRNLYFRDGNIPRKEPDHKEHNKFGQTTMQVFAEKWFQGKVKLVASRFSKMVYTNLVNENEDVLSTDTYFSGPVDLPKSTSRNITNNTTAFGSGNILDGFWKRKLNRQEVRRLQAQMMEMYMNPNVSPCTDFYTYACGNWKTLYTIPDDRVNYDTFELLRESLDFQLRDLLTTPMEEPIRDYSNIRHFNFKIKYPNETMHFGDEPTKDYQDAATKVKLLYSSCMNEEILTQRGAAPLKRLLNQLGGWPVIDPSWHKREFDLVWLLSQLKLLNNDVLISEWIGPDIKNSERYVIQIDQTTLGLPSKEYFTDAANWKYIDAYHEFIMATMVLMGARVSKANQAAKEIIEFETGLALIMIAPSERRNVSAIYIRTSVGALTSYLPHLDWLKYFTLVLNRKMSVHDSVVCYCPQYLNKLVTLLSTTRKDIIANYVLWRFVRHRTNNLDSNFIHAKQKFYQILFGRQKSPPRWQFCVNQVNANMGMAVGNLFVKRYFDERSKNDTLDMTVQLQNSFENILSKNDWIDADTKAYAKMKIKRMNLKIGYPDFLLEKQKLTSQYADVQIHPHYFFENILSLLRHSTRHEQDRFGKMVDKGTWATAPAVVNAYYSRNKNQIMFPAGILQPPFYHRFFPKALNFGGIGVVIGHEITHGFDDKGRLFDYNGNLEQWWKQSSVDKFRSRAQCLIEQYNAYIMPVIRVQVNGELTQGENIADNGGLKESFMAYKLWKESHPQADESLPGLDLTGEQLFFLNFAQIWCGMQRSESAKNRMKHAVHSPGLFRVIGTLSNSKDFARVFSCPEGSPMNPSKKCVIW